MAIVIGLSACASMSFQHGENHALKRPGIGQG